MRRGLLDEGQATLRYMPRQGYADGRTGHASLTAVPDHPCRHTSQMHHTGLVDVTGHLMSASLETDTRLIW